MDRNSRRLAILIAVAIADAGLSACKSQKGPEAKITGSSSAGPTIAKEKRDSDLVGFWSGTCDYKGSKVDLENKSNGTAKQWLHMYGENGCLTKTITIIYSLSFRTGTDADGRKVYSITNHQAVSGEVFDPERLNDEKSCDKSDWKKGDSYFEFCPRPANQDKRIGAHYTLKGNTLTFDGEDGETSYTRREEPSAADSGSGTETGSAADSGAGTSADSGTGSPSDADDGFIVDETESTD